MSGGPWERFQRPATQAQSDLPMQVAFAGAVPLTGSSMLSNQYLRELKRRIEDQRFAVGPALSAAQESGLPGVVNGPGDAFRHIVWSAELTRRFGPVMAASIVENHETSGKGDIGAAAAMDLYNNKIGMRIGQTAQTYEDVLRAAASIIMGSSSFGDGTWKRQHHPTYGGAKWLTGEWRDSSPSGQGVPPTTWLHAKYYKYGGKENKGPSLFDYPATGAAVLSEMLGLDQ
jgi:hypothetical protein